MLECIVWLQDVNGNDWLTASVTNRMCVFIIYNLVHGCDSCEKLDGVSFVSSVFTLNTDTNKIDSVLLFMPKYCYVFQKS